MGERKIENGKDLKHRTKKFALCIIRMYASLPQTAEAQVLGKEVLRSGTSVGATYRDASRGRSKTEFAAKSGDCLRELDATVYRLELLIEGGVLPKNKLADLLQEAHELSAIFGAIIKKTK